MLSKKRFLMMFFIILILINLSYSGDNNKKFNMVLVPAGEFIMGTSDAQAKKTFELDSSMSAPDWYDSEKPTHKVWIDSFYIDKYEVTNYEFKNFIEKTGYSPSGKWHEFYNLLRTSEKYKTNYDQLPAVGISWYDANSFAEWVGKRLPTEAEWEKAIRGGLDTMIYHWGNEIDLSRTNSQSDELFPVGSFPPNKYGIYDMAGNVLEWCYDFFDSNFYKNSPYKNPINQTKTEKRVLRGGSLSSNFVFYSRNSCRNSSNPNYVKHDFGFRCAMDMK